MSEDITFDTPIVKASETKLRLVALDPAQLQRSQEYLIAWTKHKIVSVRNEVDGLQQSLDIAIKAKWNTSRVKAHLQLAKQRQVFYKKLRDALQAGYYIVPDMPCDVWAIRTVREGPRTHPVESGCFYEWNAIPDEQPQLLESGKGEYHNPVPLKTRKRIEVINPKGIKEERWLFEARGFQDIVFPFSLARPEVLDTTQRAMALKIFDAIGICPQTQKRDPMILGIIKQPKRRGAPAKQITFLIAWFLDTEML